MHTQVQLSSSSASHVFPGAYASRARRRGTRRQALANKNWLLRSQETRFRELHFLEQPVVDGFARGRISDTAGAA